MMNLTVPTVTGRLRRKSIAAEVAHCLPELRFDGGEHDGTGGGTTGTAKHHAKRRGSLGGEPIRRPSLVSRWFKHISDAADAYKARTKGTHEYGDESAGGAGHPPKDSFETVTETQKIEQTSTPIERLERKDTQCRAVSSSAGHHHHHQQQQQQPSAGGGPAANASHGGPGTIGSGHHTHPGTIGSGGGGRSGDESRLSSGPGGIGTPGASANETEDNLENEEKEKYKRTQRHGSQECNGGSATDDDDVPDDEQYPRGQHPGGGGGGRGSNNTRTITQQCSLVAPSEIHVSVSATLTAEPILTPAEQLRRYDQLIQKTLASKQRVVCDMFKVPDEHFQAIADIAAQPEAPKEPTDIVLAAFAYGQTLMEILSECMRVTESQQISAVSTANCDECSVRGHGKNHIPSISNNAAAAATKESIEPTVPTIGSGGGGRGSPPTVGSTSPTLATSTSQQTPVQPIGVVSQDPTVNITEDEDGYCEIDEVRAAAVLLAENEKARKLTEAAAAAASGTTAVDTLDDGGSGDGGGRAAISPDSHIEINENYDSTMSPSMTQKYSGSLGGEQCGKNRLLHASTLAPTVPCHLIANYVTGLNAQISQLLHKVYEKDVERDNLRRENQHLRELLNAMHQERVLESQPFLEDVPHLLHRFRMLRIEHVEVEQVTQQVHSLLSKPHRSGMELADLFHHQCTVLEI
uniref:Uncharacterized protein n=1 Tax=Anopheles culicifacies TaxID=139723 RepID=A0A182MHF4_9DIPT